MPCRVRKYIWLEPNRVRDPEGARTRKKTKTSPPYLKKIKTKGVGVFVPQVPNRGLSQTIFSLKFWCMTY